MVLYLVKDTPPPSKNLYLGISRYAPILKKSKYRHAPFCLGQPSTGMNPDDARAERKRQRAMAFDARAVRAMQALQTTTSDVKEPAVDSDRRYKKRKKKHDSVMRLSDPDVCILPGDPPKEPAADAKEPAADSTKKTCNQCNGTFYIDGQWSLCWTGGIGFRRHCAMARGVSMHDATYD